MMPQNGALIIFMIIFIEWWSEVGGDIDKARMAEYNF